MASAQEGSSQRVLVSLAAAPNIESSAKWKQVQSALCAQLPLRNIHWKSASHSSIRTIQELNVDFAPLDTPREEHSQIPVTVLEKPLLNIYVVVCQNTDLEGYKNTVKKQIKDWHTAVSTRKNQEWLIVQIVRPDTRTQSANFFQLKGSVLEKIRSDFNADKRERCVQVAWSPETDAPAVWAELINKVKEGILTAFDLAIAQREEEVKRSESQRQMPGWNFCTFFILKESLASSYEGVNLPEDAYGQYEELEASFYHVSRERNLSWFGTLITPVGGDDSAPLLSIERKAYRDLILANTISVFDFRIYLLSRQCELLAQRGRMNEISRKAAAFLGAFGRRLRDVEDTLPPFFIESWIYSSALSVVEYCDNWASGFSITGSNLNSFNAAKGELLDLARTQLDIIGVNVGHLPQKPPFSSSCRPLGHRVKTTSTLGLSNSDILKAIDDAEAFYKLYVDATNRAIELYTKAGRRKFALRLHGTLAALDLHRGEYKNALAVYASLPAHYAPHMWSSLEAFMLSKALDTHANHQQEKDTEWIHILLSFLKSYVENLGAELLMHEEDQVEYITKLVDILYQAAAQLDSDLAHPNHPVVTLDVLPNARIAETKDGCYLDVTAQNHLPCVLPAEVISIILAGRDSERYTFSTPATGLPSGKTTLTLFCPAVAEGTYLLDSSELRVAKLCLQWQHRKPPTKTPSIRKETPVLVHVPKDLLALDVNISQPDKIELGEPPTLLVAVSTGRNRILKAVVQLASSGVTFRPKDAYYSGDKRSEQLQIVDNCIILEDIPEHTSVSFMIPHSDTSAFQAMKVTTEIEYTTAYEPSLSRAIRVTRVVLTTLPISVNVEDFFRGSRLFSKFTISTTSHQHVRICAARLMTPEGGLDGVKISSTATKNRGVVTVTPVQPVNFLFHIDSSLGPIRESLNLLIRYRMLREEVEAVVEKTVEKVLAESPSPHQQRAALLNQLVDALEGEAGWVDLYGITGELRVPDTSRDETNEHTAKLLKQVKEFLKNHRHPFPPEGNWNEITIPVDVPYMNIVASVSVQVSSTQLSNLSVKSGSLPLYAGQPISATISIHTSFHWGSSSRDEERKYMLRYDVEEMVRDWLVSGPKRGDFAASDGDTEIIPITLIALHHGELSLPKVSVTALPMAGELTMGSMAVPSLETFQIHGAETVLVLPRGGRSTFVLNMGSNHN